MRPASQPGGNLFADLAVEKYELEKHNLKNDGQSGRWFSPLKHHVILSLGNVPILEIDQFKVRDALAPIWREETDTALKALNRTRMVFRHAAAKGLAVNLNAVELARELLGYQSHWVKHLEAMPWRDAPAFYQSLPYEGRIHLVLKLTILTGVRPGVARGCNEQPEVNTSGPMGKLLLDVLRAVAEFETGLRRERQMEGIAKAKAAGKYKGGQPIKLEKVEKLRVLVEEYGVSSAAASREVGISRVTAHKYLVG